MITWILLYPRHCPNICCPNISDFHDLVDGPWRGALCRLGYDPRSDPESRQYQTIDFRDSYFRSISWRTHATPFTETPKSSTLPINKSAISFVPKLCQKGQTEDSAIPLDELRFHVAPTRPSQLFQLCDIDDPGVQHLVESSPVLPTCSKESGKTNGNRICRIYSVSIHDVAKYDVPKYS